jgi:hypothetical protein
MLLNLARKKGRRESEMAIEALKDLFIHNLLPNNRKLMYISFSLLTPLFTLISNLCGYFQFVSKATAHPERSN